MCQLIDNLPLDEVAVAVFGQLQQFSKDIIVVLADHRARADGSLELVALHIAPVDRQGALNALCVVTLQAVFASSYKTRTHLPVAEPRLVEPDKASIG